jgi:hypothetical protein
MPCGSWWTDQLHHIARHHAPLGGLAHGPPEDGMEQTYRVARHTMREEVSIEVLDMTRL